MYRTIDFKIICLLYYLKIKIIEMDRNNPHEIVFTFEDKDLCEKMVLKYYNKELQVEPVGFVDAIDQVKAMVFKK